MFYKLTMFRRIFSVNILVIDFLPEIDNDVDSSFRHCAILFGGPWWYISCYHVILMKSAIFVQTCVNLHGRQLYIVLASSPGSLGGNGIRVGCPRAWGRGYYSA